VLEEIALRLWHGLVCFNAIKPLLNSAAPDTSFARLVALACHDLRTPLATVNGFARTLARLEGLGEPADQYVAMIEAAARQMADLLDELGLVARIEAGRFEPLGQTADTLELARGAADALGSERVFVTGEGGPAGVDPAPMGRAVTALVQCALRHGGLEQVEVVAMPAELSVSPITAASAPVVLGEDLRDLGAAAAVRLIEAVGGTVSLEADTLRVKLPV
jgi:signal transduction histidine kinase